MRSKSIGLALKFEGEITVFALFYLVFEVNFPSYKPPGALYLEGRFNGGFFYVTGLGGLYMEFYGILALILFPVVC